MYRKHHNGQLSIEEFHVPFGGTLDPVTYSVPSRLIGQQLTVHLHHDRLDLFLRSHYLETLPRLHRRAGESGPWRRIDFRHVIESLRRKPRALLRAQLQDDLLPGESWRQLWRQLLAALPPDEAAKVMVDALHVAAKTDDLAAVERYLRRQLRSGEITSAPCVITTDCGPPGALPCLSLGMARMRSSIRGSDSSEPLLLQVDPQHHLR